MSDDKQIGLSEDDTERQLEEADGLGDALYGLFPDEDADAVEVVREVRERYTTETDDE